MAERRMFAKAIVDSDAFLEMPMSSRLLYYDLGMRADDDGFVNSPKKIMRICGNTDDDLKILMAKKFIIFFENGIIVIKHWRLNNYLRKDRYRETTYLEEKAELIIEDNEAYKRVATKRYTNGIPNGIPELSTNDASETDLTSNHAPSEVGIPVGIPTVDAGKDRLGKDRLGKDRLGNIPEPPTNQKTKEEKNVYAEYVKMTEKEYNSLIAKFGHEKATRCIEILNAYKGSTGKTYKSDYMTMFSWVSERYEEELRKKTYVPANQQSIKDKMQVAKEKLQGMFQYEE